jgi:carbon-monoxide dehydrogenase small subunit
MILTVNGQQREVDVPPMKRLLDTLREDLGLTGTKEGCGEGECGACTVELNGESVNSCLVATIQAVGMEVRTIEASEHPMLHSFCELGGAQCGICTPGMIVAAEVFTRRWREQGHEGAPPRKQLREALAGNLCRCTGYEKILDSVIDGVQRETAAK